MVFPGVSSRRFCFYSRNNGNRSGNREAGWSGRYPGSDTSDYEEHEGDPGSCRKTLVFVADIDQFSIFNETYKQYFPENPPARSTMQVGKFNGGMAIEIEAIAVIEK